MSKKDSKIYGVDEQLSWQDIIVYPVVGILMSIALFVLHPVAGGLGLLATAFMSVVAYRREQEHIDASRKAMESLNEDFDEVTKSAVFGMPFPMSVLTSQGNFLWYNTQFKDLFGIETSVIGETYQELLPNIKLEQLREKSIEPIEQEIGGQVYCFYHNYTAGKNRDHLILLYGVDNTDDAQIYKQYVDEQLVIMSIHFDNYEEVRSRTAEADRPIVFAEVDREINNAAKEYNALVTKYETDRYLMILYRESFERIEREKFHFLDRVREIKGGNDLAPTLSIGVGASHDIPPRLNQESKSAVDIALSRGGDQVVIKVGEDLTYFGGKNQATTKHSKVKSRVMAHAVAQLIDDASEVFLMGHANPDMDSIGCCLGMWAVANNRGKTAYIVIDEVTPAIDNIYEKVIQEMPEMKEHFLFGDQVMGYAKPTSLIVVLDNHRKNSVAYTPLLDVTEKIVIIDHHRRGNGYIEDAAISYIEPYASSTSELVTELISYLDDNMKIDRVIAEALLAGITVDTKNFYYQTGVRTFEAAAALKRRGADSIVVKQLFKDDLELVRYKSEVISTAVAYNHHTIIGKFPHDIEGSTLIASQAADDLLDIRGITASFVLTVVGKRIHISARSLGDVSVQLIMERIGGGGHLTAAATQIDTSMDAAEDLLKKAIDEYYEEEMQDEDNID